MMTSLPGLSADQQRLVAMLLAGQGAAARPVDAGPGTNPGGGVTPDTANRHQPFPLTDIQQAYWLGRSRAFDLGGVASHGYQEYECGALDAARFDAALNRVVARHDMLRAVVGDDGLMRILPEVPAYTVAVKDLSALDEDERRRRLEETRRAMSHRVPDPARWPLFDIRASLIGPDLTRVHVSCDAIVADVYSIFLCLDELGRFYLDPAASLPPLSLSFRDYVLALKAEEDRPAFAATERHWLDRLDGLSPAPDLPLAPLEDDTAKAAATEPHRFARRTARLSPERWAAFKRRCAALGLTPSLVLLTAYGDTLAQWSRDAAMTLNVTLFNRPPLHPEIERIMGDFTSTLLLDLGAPADPEESFKERATRVQARFWQDFEHAAFSGVRVLQQLAQRRRAPVSMPIVFTSAIGTGDVGRALDTANNLLGRPRHAITQTPQVRIDHQVFEIDGGLGVNWDVVEGLFAPGVIEAMFAAHGALLDALADGDDAWNAPRPVALPAAQRTARDRANATAQNLGAPGLLHLPVLAQALATPERRAIAAPDRDLSYGELAARALALAQALEPLCSRRDADLPRVAIALPKGWEQAVAVLATLIAGAAYVPLDPDLPKPRRDAILAQAGPVALLSSRRLIATLDHPLPAIAVEEAEPGPMPDTLPTPRQSPGDLAYLIFTSGSTGTPKGVAIQHQAALNTIRDINTRFAVTQDDAVFALSSLSFDLSVYDLFGPLATGAHLVLPAPGETRDPQAWLRRLDRNPVTLWNSVPALWQMLVEHGAAPAAPPRLALLSGDWIPPELPARSRDLMPGCRLLSLGGATEAAVWSIAWPIADAPEPGWRSVPYGRPLANQRVHVLDDQLRERPDWVAGPLFIAGDGLARGYWNDPERTADQFPVHPETGERLYRTGDIARWRPTADGGVAVEFLGRADHQVKVAGHRIELGDVEAALAAHPAVVHAVAHAPGTPPAPRRLVAFVVPHNPADPPDPAELRAFLAQRLPNYMVPTAIIPIPELPLSQNGKIDRKKLPDVDAAALAAPTDGDDAPAEGLESVLASVWRDLLGDTLVGRYSHFFELGGNSLLAVRLVNALRDRHGLELPLRTVFAEPALSDLAKHLAPLAGNMRPPLEDLTPRSGGSPLFCVTDALGGAGSFQDLAAAWRGDTALVAVNGAIDDDAPDALETAISAIADVIAERQPGGPLTLLGYSSGGIVAWEVTATLEQRGRSVERLVLIDSHPLPASLADDHGAIAAIVAATGGDGDLPLSRRLRRTIAAAARAELRPIRAPLHLFQTAELAAAGTGWAERKTASLQIDALDGTHATCLRAPHCTRLAASVAALMAVEEPA